jgi:hypothetical protein
MQSLAARALTPQVLNIGVCHSLLVEGLPKQEPRITFAHPKLPLHCQIQLGAGHAVGVRDDRRLAAEDRNGAFQQVRLPPFGDAQQKVLKQPAFERVGNFQEALPRQARTPITAPRENWCGVNETNPQFTIVDERSEHKRTSGSQRFKHFVQARLA